MENMIVLYQVAAVRITVMLLIHKFKYGMNPLTVTWPPAYYIQITVTKILKIGSKQELKK